LQAHAICGGKYSLKPGGIARKNYEPWRAMGLEVVAKLMKIYESARGAYFRKKLLRAGRNLFI
jgi:hypothetical protein